MQTPEVDLFLAALDVDDVDSILDIGGGAPELAAAIHHRFGAKIDLIRVDETGKAIAFSKKEKDVYIKAVEKLGVKKSALKWLSSSAKLSKYDVVLSINEIGMNFRFKHIAPILSKIFHDQARMAVTIAKGSGGYPFLGEYGACNTLRAATAKEPALVVMSIEPKPSATDQWSSIAQELVGKDGFFTDCGEHSFLYVPRGDTLVVTFDNLDIAMTKRDDRRPWGFSFIENNGWSMLGVMANGWTWFRDDAVVAEFDRLRDSGFFDQFKRVIFYGASMGGYAAAAYSAAVKGSTVFVMSPQSTLDKELVPWEMRYKGAWGRDYSGHYGDAAITSQSAERVHLMYDPFQISDAKHVARFTGDNVKEWRCSLLGHRLGSSLSQMGILQDIATKAILGELDDATFYKLLRKRRQFRRYQRELANLALSRGHPKLALMVCEFVLKEKNDSYFRDMAARINAS